MRTRYAFVMVLLVPAILYAQTNVDRLTHALDSLGVMSYDNWRVSPDLKRYHPAGDPTEVGFDDSRWDTLRLNQWIYPDSCWLRKEITLPGLILGQPVSGPVRLLVTVDDAGYMWVNGESKGYFPWDGTFELTPSSKPGQKFLIAIKAVNTGGPLRLLRAEVESDSSKPIRDRISDFSLSFRVGQKLLSFDTYQTNSHARIDPGTDKSTMDRNEKTRLRTLLQDLAAKVDVDALATGKLDRFRASLDNMRAQLKPIGDFAKRFTLFFDSNAHIDAAWLWRWKETVEVCKNTFSSVINMMNARPDFTYTQSAAVYYSWMQHLYPALFNQIKQRVADGRWEVVGGMWVEPDCNLPSGESWARHLLYADRYFQKNLGVTAKIGWNPDSFGYNWNMPALYRNAGIDAFITQKIGWNDTDVFPYRVFWWEGPDGSKILSYFPFDYVNTVDDPYQLVDWMRQFEANSGFTKMLILFGVGDHGGGPSLDMLKRIDHLKSLDVYPSIEFGTTTKYLNWLKSQNLSAVPTWESELYLEYHRGTYTNQAKMKHFNRANEVLLTETEKASSLATLCGREYNSADLKSAWENVLFNQFHDILPGSGIRQIYIDATEMHKQARQIGQYELAHALSAIASKVNTTRMRAGTPVMVFNPLSWTRTDVVRVALPEGDPGGYSVYTADGKPVPSQEVTTGKYQHEVLFVAKDVPSIGYSVYELRRAASARPEAATGPAWSIENESFRVEVDSATGWVRSIYDKKNNREVLQGEGNRLQLLQDLPKQWDAWNLGLTGVEYPSTFRKAELVENGPVRTIVRLWRDYLKPGVKKDFPTEDFPNSFFTQDIILYHGIDRIDFRLDADWWEEHTMLKVAFPVAVSDTVATYEIPYGEIRRSTLSRTSWQKAQFEVPAERWADLSSGGYGVSLINNSKYGYDIKGSLMRLSLLRGAIWPDPTADRGQHTIDYCLYPHAGSWDDGGTVRRGYEFNYPLVATMTSVHRGTLPASHSFVSIEPSNLILTTIKKAEDSDAWVLEWYDAGAKACDARLTLPAVPKSVVQTNFLEGDGPPIAFRGNTATVPTRKNGIVTVKVTF